jgi:ATP-binding cassette subfamily B protein
MLRDALSAEAYDREYTNRELIRRIGRYFAPYRGKTIAVVVLVALLALLGAATPVLIAAAVGLLDTSAGSADALIAALVVGVLLLGVLTWGVNYGRRLFTAELMGSVVLDMRTDAFRAVINHDLSFFDQFQSGRIVSRITSDTDEFGRVAVLATEIVSQMLLVAILLAYLARVNWQLALGLTLIAPVGYFIGSSFQNVARRTTRQSQRVIAEVNVSIQEAVTGIRVAKNFRREQGIYDEFLRINEQSYRTQVKRGLIFASLFPALQFFIGIGTAALLYAGGYSVYVGVITAGAWFLFMNSVGEFWYPMTNLSGFWSQFQSALSATERIFALMDARPAIVQRDDQPVAGLRGDIRFEQVDFAYTDKEQVLRGFTLHIRPGESVALVGHTGAGKSSIAKLVTRYYEFQAGRLLVDGRDIRTLDLGSYRRHLGVVSQTPFLFAGTIADNVRYGTPHLDDAQAEAVCRRIGGGEWLENLPEGLQTNVGERGNRLSMGQRQLVVLARMLALDPAILVLDEATASVDPFTEAQIQEALALLLKNRTSIAIAHRLSTVKAADRILVLRRGRIIEEGSHDDLMRRGGHYAELYNTYFRHQSVEFMENRAWAREQAPDVA